ncbi:MAG TPA: efflux RND transporter periplasmic adaptor subunit [Amaricoccus sp.]|nr:efflux RND transporter periplasmic adaptor subunit [Amaricoccus sp.]
MRRRHIAIAVTGLGVALAGAAGLPEVRAIFTAMAAPAETPAPSPEPQVVMVSTVRPEAAAPVRRLAGTVRARTETDLGFRVGGKLLARPAEVGASVKAGEVVARLDETDLSLELEAAEAARAAARIALEKGEVDLARVTTLESKGWASDQATDARTVDVEELRARLLQAERSVELAKNALSYATLHADADGVVTATHAEAGQVLAPGQPVVSIARDGEREAVVSVPEAMVGEVGGATAVAELWSEPGKRHPVRLRELSPVADSATRTYEAHFTLPPEVQPALGMSVTVTLAPRAERPAYMLPTSALLDSGSGPTVWVVGSDDRLEPRRVVVAGYEAGAARIADGLAGGERVVVLGAHRLQAGTPVRPMPAEG